MGSGYAVNDLLKDGSRRRGDRCDSNLHSGGRLIECRLGLVYETWEINRCDIREALFKFIPAKIQTETRDSTCVIFTGQRFSPPGRGGGREPDLRRRGVGWRGGGGETRTNGRARECHRAERIIMNVHGRIFTERLHAAEEARFPLSPCPLPRASSSDYTVARAR